MLLLKNLWYFFLQYRIWFLSFIISLHMMALCLSYAYIQLFVMVFSSRSLHKLKMVRRPLLFSYLVRQSEIWVECTNDNEIFCVYSIVTFAQIFKSTLQEKVGALEFSHRQDILFYNLDKEFFSHTNIPRISWRTQTKHSENDLKKI